MRPSLALALPAPGARRYKRFMAERELPEPLRDLDTRLKRLRAEDEEQARADAARERGRGLSLALRVGIELVAALIVGVGMGLLLDSWLGTGPWLLIVFFVLGAAAGMLNVYRAMSGMGGTAGYAKGEARSGGKPADTEPKADPSGKR